MSQLPPENVQEYPRPPALEHVPYTLRLILGGETVAETTQALRVLETHHAPTYYIPRHDVLAELIPARGASFCEWKGTAIYFDLQAGSRMAPRAAWSYPSPTATFQALAGHVAFYASAMDACFVGEEQVLPQPGDFYGGWVTANLQGRIKGAPGSAREREMVDAAPEIAIIGAGMAGLTCARALKERGLKSVIFDKGRGLGGRMATRRADGGFQFDHGAQYLSARGSGFADMLHRAEAAGAVARWPESKEPTAFVGIPGMTGLAKHLSEGLDIRSATRVQSITSAQGRWHLEWQDGKALFDRVVVTAPAPQIVPLLPQTDDFSDALKTVEMDPCLTLMIGLPHGFDLPFMIRRTPDEDISWIARDSAKPGRPSGTCVVAQASRDWSLRHLELEQVSITERMLHLVAPIIGTSPNAAPVYMSAHRWRYAFVAAPLGQPYLHNRANTLFAGGDWCLGAKAEDAWTSGRVIADALAEGL